MYYILCTAEVNPIRETVHESRQIIKTKRCQGKAAKALSVRRYREKITFTRKLTTIS